MPIAFEARATEAVPRRFYVGVSQQGQCMAQGVRPKAAPSFKNYLCFAIQSSTSAFVLSFP
jgi:hypothetical protein